MSIQSDRLAQYLEAERVVLSGQSYTIGNRTLTRANLATIRQAIDSLIASGVTLDDSVPAVSGMSKRVVFIDGR